jgi:hypothetical protein
MEIMAHNGGLDPVDAVDFARKTGDVAEDLKILGLNADTWVNPGTWVGTNNHYDITTSDFHNTTEDYILKHYFGAYMASIYNNGSSGGTLPITEEKRYGLSVYSPSDNVPEIEAAIDSICTNHKCIVILIHAANLDSDDGLTTEHLLTILDYIKTKIDAGSAVNMTPTQMMYATQS